MSTLVSLLHCATLSFRLLSSLCNSNAIFKYPLCSFNQYSNSITQCIVINIERSLITVIQRRFFFSDRDNHFLEHIIPAAKRALLYLLSNNICELIQAVSHLSTVSSRVALNLCSLCILSPFFPYLFICFSTIVSTILIPGQIQLTSCIPWAVWQSNPRPSQKWNIEAILLTVQFPNSWLQPVSLAVVHCYLDCSE